MLFDGLNGGKVELLEKALVIRRQGALSFLNQGLKGEKRIPYTSIGSIQFKDAGFTTGYIQFGVGGGVEDRGGVFNAVTDENTVLFTKDAAPQFNQLRDIVEAKIHDGANASSGHASTTATSVAEELTKLADLRDRGVLSEEEFEQQKQLLLGRNNGQSGATTVAQDAPSAASTAQLRSGHPARRGLDPTGIAEASSQQQPRRGRALGFGCLGVLGILIALSALGSNIESEATAAADRSDIAECGESETDPNARCVPSLAKSEEPPPEGDSSTAASEGKSVDDYSLVRKAAATSAKGEGVSLLINLSGELCANVLSSRHLSGDTFVVECQETRSGSGTVQYQFNAVDGSATRSS